LCFASSAEIIRPDVGRPIKTSHATIYLAGFCLGESCWELCWQSSGSLVAEVRRVKERRQYDFTLAAATNSSSSAAFPLTVTYR
jgi:hypothetical protein